jgi:hypothetical protein
MTTLIEQVDLCFDKIEKLEGKHDDGTLGEGSNKGKHVD